MKGPAPWELLNSENYYRQNANIPSHIVTVLDEIEADYEYCTRIRDSLFTEPEIKAGEAVLHPAEKLLRGLSEWSRGEAMKGSEQIVRSFLGQPEKNLDGEGTAPDLTPHKPPNAPSSVAVVAYQSAKNLKKDIRRKRWEL